MNCTLKNNTLSILRKAIGNESYLFKSKITFSSLIYLKGGNLEDSYIIKKTPNTPQFLEDWIIYLTMRSAARTFLTTGKMIRDEKDVNTYSNLDFYGYEDIERLFYAQKDEYDVKKPKNIFTLSKSQSLKDIFEIQFFKEDYAVKYVMLNEKDKIVASKDESVIKYFDNYNIKLVDDEINGIDDAMNYIKKNVKDCFPILFELGPTIMMEYLDVKENEGSMLDFVLISAYTGYLSEDCIGPRFPSIKKLTKGMKLVNVSEEIPSENGYLKFYTYIKEENSDQSI
jgi:hypothetical protein